MLQRERGWALEGPHRDVWAKETDKYNLTPRYPAPLLLLSCNANFRRYMNTITGGIQRSPPPEFRGGLLADQMGLGKSLTVIALIASNPATNLVQVSPNMCKLDGGPAPLNPVKTTLLVVPLSCEFSPFIRHKIDIDQCISASDLGKSIRKVRE